ncbi:hypothetical protein BO70DRAFT_93817 [Aspergillus heteromorphus CBS 117.55]|uniref:Uncharacterized protein n=1 Tax=Aspergillus heteromorphus CBS 117.55 TaxID=1448321 RepID=A0A317VTE0_9EURO|nr:uncharacterized protein BO70DRAFT_93817 [Aspergillus heteromorphus CBS 117.55]PWY76287.1 hypothetical protein BO70DRAFT_93817 [Aspergillus heteromorphus CBS 117.55]
MIVLSLSFLPADASQPGWHCSKHVNQFHIYIQETTHPATIDLKPKYHDALYFMSQTNTIPTYIHTYHPTPAPSLLHHRPQPHQRTPVRPIF